MVYRSEYCGEVNLKQEGQVIKLAGWVHAYRNLGQLVFLELRDYTGRVQVVFESEKFPELKHVRLEWVLTVEARVKAREKINPDLPTGQVEAEIISAEILAQAEPMPVDFNLSSTSEKSLLQYRYLSLRQPRLQHNLRVRHKTYIIVRNFLNSQKFLEVETPTLYKSTPEGARDFLVPSRVHPGEFYALPQSPQTLKQLLMIGGCDRYYQIVRCFRDEDLRADRQPEFTQVDIEMSFVKTEDVISLISDLFKKLWKEIKGVTLEDIPCLSYDDAISDYGTDAPDLRIPWKLEDVSSFFKGCDFKVFSSVLDAGGVIKALKVPEVLSRSQIDVLTKLAKEKGAKGLAWIKNTNGKIDSSVSKFFSSDLLASLCNEPKTTMLLISDSLSVASLALGAIRVHLGHKLLSLEAQQDRLVWVHRFPMFQYDEMEDRWFCCHHPFTAAKDADTAEQVLKEPVNSKTIHRFRSATYDIVCNGMELGGGGLRIFNSQLQSKVFSLLKISDEEIQSQFGFFIEALKYGTPPHGGIALGLDRIVMVLCNESSIRSVIAFPKTTSASCLMSAAPSKISQIQLKDLSIQTIVKKGSR